METMELGTDASRIPAVLQALAPVLIDLGNAQKTAREIYIRLLEEVASRYGWVPNGSDLVEIVSGYNRMRSPGHAKLPLGSASVSRAAVAEFQERLARSYRQKPKTKLLPEALLNSVGELFDSMVEQVRGQFEQDAQQVLASVNQSWEERLNTEQSQHESALAALRKVHGDELGAALRRLAELEQTHEELLQAHDVLTTALAAERDRNEQLVSRTDELAQRVNVATTNEAVVRTRLASLKQQYDALEKAHAGEVLNAKEELRVRLLTLDRSRQLEIALTKETAEHESLKATHLEMSKRVSKLESQVLQERAKTEAVTLAAVARQGGRQKPKQPEKKPAKQPQGYKG